MLPGGLKLWLVGVLRSPEFSKNQWVANENEAPVTDISSIKRKLRFASGAGITAKKGALGMSLQTPRTLTIEDIGLLNSTVDGCSASKAKTTKKRRCAKRRQT